MIVGFQPFGNYIQLTTNYTDKHNLTRDNARRLGEALILMANLADEMDKDQEVRK